VGAVNRARRSLALVEGAEFGVGIEGALVELYGREFCTGFVVVVRRDGRMGVGTSGWFQCPQYVVRGMLKGEELGDLMDEVVGRVGVKREEGAIGIFTRGLVTRTDLYEHGIYMALTPFLGEGLWGERT